MSEISEARLIPGSTDPHAFFNSTIARLIGNAKRDLALAQANGETLTAIKARVRLDTLTAALEIHRASLKVADQNADQQARAAGQQP
jgi:hypothetical protein